MHDSDFANYTKKRKIWPHVTTVGEAEHGQIIEVPWIFDWVRVRVCWGAKRVPYVRVVGCADEPRKGPWPLPASFPARTWIEENSW